MGECPRLSGRLGPEQKVIEGVTYKSDDVVYKHQEEAYNGKVEEVPPVGKF